MHMGSLLFTYEYNFWRIRNTVVSLQTAVQSHVLSLRAVVRVRKHPEKVNKYEAMSQTPPWLEAELYLRWESETGRRDTLQENL